MTENDYLTMPAVEREYSQRPKGMKHYSTEEIYEATALERDLFLYRIRSAILGGDYEQRNERKVRPRHSKRIIY